MCYNRGGWHVNVLINYAGTCANLISVLQQEQTKSCNCMSSSRGFIIPSAQSPLRLISHKCTFQRRTQITWKSLYRVNEWLAFLLSLSPEQGSPRKMLHKGGDEGFRDKSSSQLRKELLWEGFVTLHGALQQTAQLQKQLPHVGQTSNTFKIEQVLLREGVPTDAAV